MFSVKTFAIVFAASFVHSALAHCVRKYTVQEGDICDAISAANHVSTYQLATVNEGVIDSTCSNLIPGSEICLGWEGVDCDQTYVVQADDTCEAIAAANGLNTTILNHNNPQINENCDNIYIGEVLCVAGSVQAPPVPASGLPAATVPPTATAAVATPTNTQVDVPVTEPAAPSPKPQAKNDNQGNNNNKDDEDCDEDDHEEDNKGNGDVNKDTDIDDEDLPYCDEI